MGISNEELDERQDGCKGSLYTKSFVQKIDLNVFEWRTKRQFIITPDDRNTCVGSGEKFSL
jgi:hypothetical protein